MFKPLLASPVDLDLLQFPVLVSPKLDGIRALTLPAHGLVSRKLKPIPNRFIRSHWFPDHLDGEIVTYTSGVLDDFNTIQSKVMSQDGEPDFKWVVFDCFMEPNLPYSDRLIQAEGKIEGRNLEILPHWRVKTIGELMAAEQEFLDAGYEGLMMRSPRGVYKFGRSTAREQILLKMKRFLDSEATIVGKVEKMHNDNPLERDALGNAKRSSAKAGKVPADTLGALVCAWNNVQFEIGTGFDDDTRKALWNADIIGKKVTFKFQELSPAGVPRFPVFLGLRHDL